MSTQARRYVTARDLCARWSVSRMTLWRWQQDGYIPKPVRFAGRTTRWPLAEVEEFERRLELDRGAAA